MSRRWSAFVLALVSCLAFQRVHGAVPTLINYQGILTDKARVPQAGGPFSVTFSIYDEEAPGSNPALWSETQAVTTDDQGRFNVLLGSISALTATIFSGSDRWLAIRISPDLLDMTPRTRIVAVAYAFRPATVDGANGGTISGDVRVTGGNMTLDQSTAITGSIVKDGVPFVHNYGTGNTFVGLSAGNLTMTGNSNTANGTRALSGNTSGYENTACGWETLTYNTTGHANTACGIHALAGNTTADWNTAIGTSALFHNTTGSGNTASGNGALFNNTTGSDNTAVGDNAGVSTGALTNATAIGAYAVVNASNKIRLGNSAVTVIEGQVAYTFSSDGAKKENFRPVDGDEVLRKIRGFNLTSWNYKGNDARKFRHYGPVAQDFFAAFGHDGMGTSGDSVTINSGDMAGIMMIAIQTLEKRTAENAELKARIERLERLMEGKQGDWEKSAE